MDRPKAIGAVSIAATAIAAMMIKLLFLIFASLLIQCRNYLLLFDVLIDSL